jgi:hypothetical protein
MPASKCPHQTVPSRPVATPRTCAVLGVRAHQHSAIHARRVQRVSRRAGEKGVRSHLCKAPGGPFRQMTPDPFFGDSCHGMRGRAWNPGTVVAAQDTFPTRRHSRTPCAAGIASRAGDRGLMRPREPAALMETLSLGRCVIVACVTQHGTCRCATAFVLSYGRSPLTGLLSLPTALSGFVFALDWLLCLRVTSLVLVDTSVGL